MATDDNRDLGDDFKISVTVRPLFIREGYLNGLKYSRSLVHTVLHVGR